MEKKQKLYNLQLKLLEREKDHKINNKLINDKKDLNDLQMKMIKLKLQINNEHEIELKKLLNIFKESDSNDTQANEKQLKTTIINQLGNEFINELKDKFKININYCFNRRENILVNMEGLNHYFEDLNEEDESDEDYLDEDSKFHDAYEDPESIIEEEQRQKQLKLNEINKIKKKILSIGSKKSALRLSLVFYF